MEDKGAFSFSTCWNIKRHNAGGAMLREIRDLGFRRVELNYNVTKEMLTTIEPMIERGRLAYPVFITRSPTLRTPIMARILCCSAFRIRRRGSGQLSCWSVQPNMRSATAVKLLLCIPAKCLFE